MARKPLFDDQEIIARGEEIERERGSATPREIHVALGERGRYVRIAEIWEGHCAECSAQAARPTMPAPDRAEEVLDALLAETHAAIVRVLAREAEDRKAAHRREMLDLRRGGEEREGAWSEALTEAHAEITHLRGLVDRYESAEPGPGPDASGEGGTDADRGGEPDAPAVEAAAPPAPAPAPAPTETAGASAAPVACAEPAASPPCGTIPAPPPVSALAPTSLERSPSPPHPPRPRAAPARPIRHDEVRRGGGGGRFRPGPMRAVGRGEARGATAPAGSAASRDEGAKPAGRRAPRPDADVQPDLPLGR